MKPEFMKNLFNSFGSDFKPEYLDYILVKILSRTKLDNLFDEKFMFKYFSKKFESTQKVKENSK